MPSYTEDLATLSRSLDAAFGPAKDALNRIVGELEFAGRLCELHPDESDKWSGLIQQAAAHVKTGIEGGSTDVLALVRQAEDILAPIGTVAKEYTILNVGHGHIDMNWMWSWQETVSVTVDTFNTVLTLMDTYDDFTYAQSQASVYDLLRVHDPELLARIRERIAEGRWEVSASHWVEADKNISNGESFCRHLLYTRQFAQEHLGLTPADVPIDWEPDTFGHAATIPTFLAAGGVRRYYHCRSGIGQDRPAVFWWEAPDGSRVLVYHEIPNSWYNGRVEPRMTEPFIAFCKETGLKTWLNVYGVGDHGGGPTREDIERCHDMHTWPIYPNWTMSTISAFYDLLEEHGDTWPVLDHELNFEFQGCYTTQTSIKRANRFSENRLYQAEAAAAIASAQTGMNYPGERLREGWINTLFSQFHDILPGSGVRDTRDYCMGQFQETLARTTSITARALRSLASQVNTAKLAGGAAELPGPATGAGAGFDSEFGGVSRIDGQAGPNRPFVVYNLSGWKRSEVVEATLWDTGWDTSRICVEDDEGNICAAQFIDKGHYWGHEWITVAFPAPKIPAMGYRTFVVREGKADYAEPLAHPERGVVENEFVRVEIDWETGGIASLIDKQTGEDLADPESPMGLYEFAIERHHGMSAWVIGDIASSDILTTVKSLDVKTGPYKTVFTSTIEIAASKIVTQAIVRAGDPTVELNISVDWFERGTPERGVPMLRLHIPTGLDEVTPRYEIPYGTLTRTLTDGEEVPSQRFVDLMAKKTGLLVTNDSKYGFAVEDTSLRATLIRSSYDPDPLPDIGDHTIRFGIRPHGAKGWSEADCIRGGADMNQPLQVVGTGAHDGPLAPSGSWLKLKPENVVLAAVKRSESGDGMILRFYETAGEDTEIKVKLDDVFRASEAVQVDLLERPVETNTAEIDDGKLRIEVPAYGIVSVLVR